VAHALAGDLEITQRVAVQHHHAHVAACIAEHGARGPVIGVAFDGTGLGTDGAIWGGEFLLVRQAAFTRLGHLGYVALPGGDAAIRHPWRSAAAHQAAAGMSGTVPPGIGDVEWRGVQQLLGRAETRRTSSVGRLFDAVASLLGICQVARFEGEAAMTVEGMANPRATRRYPVTITGDAPWTIEPGDIIRGVIEDRGNGIAAADIAGAFHLTLCDAIVAGCERIRESTGLDVVALSGGVFMNALLLTSAQDALAARGFDVLVPRDVPCNDGGLALGQAYVAAHALREDVCA
jgi:hydrogenase maturation protein HypF